jgi:hypothetical protein
MYPPLMNRSLHTFHKFPTTLQIKPNYTPLYITPRSTLPGLKFPSAVFATCLMSQHI